MVAKNTMNDKNVLNIMIVGVGGQGTLLASRILGAVALERGYDVKVSEVHGMSQRGGSVVTYVRMGSKVLSPLVEKGEADIILAFEILEALRWKEYLKQGGRIITSSQKIDPMPVVMRKAEYPADAEKKLLSISDDGKANVIIADAPAMAEAAGNLRAANVVLIGIMASSTGIAKEIWTDVIKRSVPSKFEETNLKAFEAGYGFAAKT